VEAKTYRYCDHQESDFKLPNYRPEEEVSNWRARDPIDGFAARLQRAGRLNVEEFDAIKAGVQQEVEAALTFAQQSPAPEPSALFEDVFV
jgi:TPP-dependent pyruvate/acetoin dehydrogenase alpha subunit